MKLLRRLWKENSGVVIAEAAMILPVFCLVGFGLMDMQWCLRSAADLEYVVTETARCEAIQSAACVPGATSYAVAVATGIHLDTSRLTIVSSTCNPGVSCAVSATYAYKPMGPYFPAITLSRTGISAVPGGGS